jgi:hypothetical protein
MLDTEDIGRACQQGSREYRSAYIVYRELESRLRSRKIRSEDARRARVILMLAMARRTR